MATTSPAAVETRASLMPPGYGSSVSADVAELDGIEGVDQAEDGAE